MKARIFQKPKNAMQSGRAGTGRWMLEFAPAEARKADPLMGWAGANSSIQRCVPARPDCIAFLGFWKIRAFIGVVLSTGACAAALAASGVREKGPIAHRAAPAPLW